MYQDTQCVTSALQVRNPSFTAYDSWKAQIWIFGTMGHCFFGQTGLSAEGI